MQPEQLTAIFDQQAAGYDRQAQRREPIENALRYLLEAVFADLPTNAHVLSVGSGTGTEVIALAQRFPHWHFTLVEPSAGMVEVCRQNLKDAGIAERCTLQQGYLESVSPAKQFDAATCFLVSQFLVEPEKRSAFFRQLSQRLKPGAPLASSDLMFDTRSPQFDTSLALWQHITTGTPATKEQLERMKLAYTQDVAVWPMEAVATMVLSAGFDAPLPFFQAGLVQAWVARRSAN